MHITFTQTVTPPDAHTTFREGRTYLMPDAMAQGFIEREVAREASADRPATAPQDLTPSNDETGDPPGDDATTD
ncbi:MAG: hypothetical protein ACPHCN_18850 [Mycobacterium sp.]